VTAFADNEAPAIRAFIGVSMFHQPVALIAMPKGRLANRTEVDHLPFFLSSIIFLPIPVSGGLNRWPAAHTAKQKAASKK